VAIIEVKNVSKFYGTGQSRTHALGPVSFAIKQGEFAMIIGRSGSGKSTMLNLLCGLDKSSQGSVVINGQNLSTLSKDQLSKYRSTIGIVFQSYNLLPNLNTTENVLLGAWASGQSVVDGRAEELLKLVNLGHRMDANVKNLSGGEKQRVSIARSLVADPSVIFCDEPTGALDSHNEEVVINILKNLNKLGKTIVMVTHNPDFLKYADQVIELVDGKVIKNTEVKKISKPKPIKKK
jgi:putative ABC transport system ATP-binding protein